MRSPEEEERSEWISEPLGHTNPWDSPEDTITPPAVIYRSREHVWPRQLLPASQLLKHHQSKEWWRFPPTPSLIFSMIRYFHSPLQEQMWARIRGQSLGHVYTQAGRDQALTLLSGIPGSPSSSWLLHLGSEIGAVPATAPAGHQGQSAPVSTDPGMEIPFLPFWQTHRWLEERFLSHLTKELMQTECGHKAA